MVLKSEPELWVRLMKDARRIEMDGPTRVVVRTNQGAAPVLLPCPIVVTSSNRGLSIRDGKGQIKTWGYGTDVEIVATDGSRNTGGVGSASLAPPALLRVDGATVPGFVSLRPRWQDYPCLLYTSRCV